MKSDYLKLDLIKNKLERKIIKDEIRETHRIEAKSFRREHRKAFLFVDVAVAIIILMNFGALAITNALVMKDNPEPVFYEANPVASEIYGFEEIPDTEGMNGEIVSGKEAGKEIMNTLIIFSLYWTLLLFIYVIHRNRIRSTIKFNLLIFMVIFYFMILGTDFINNFGYFVGVRIWG